MALYPKIGKDFLTNNSLYGQLTPPQYEGDPIAAQGLMDAPALYNPQQFTPPPADIQEEDSPGFLRRIRSQPGGDRALLEFGAAMLSSNSFGEGLGKGALAYRTALDAEAEKGRPKLTKDNEFTYRINPETGEPEFTQTAVGDFTERQNIRKLTTAELIAKTNQAAMTDRTGMTIEANKERWAAQDALARDRLDAEGNWRDEDRTGRETVARIMADSRLDLSDRNASNRQTPAGIQTQIGDNQNLASQAAGTIEMGTPVVEALGNGTLKLGAGRNLLYTGMLKSGIGVSPEARAYGHLQQFIASLANTILMDAKGVQTDGDAVRARLQILVAEGDSQAVAEEVNRAMQGVERARRHAIARSTDLASQYGANTTAVDANRGTPRPPSSGRQSSLRSKYGLE